MTTEQKYQAVAQAIRQALPRMVEVGEGCFIKHKKYNWKRKIIHINKERFYMIEIDGFHPIDILSYKIKDFDKNKWEIIGKEPTILDVLEWLYSINYNSEIDNYGLLNIRERTKKGMLGMVLGMVEINLSQPYLKDHSEELINFLYELIEK